MRPFPRASLALGLLLAAGLLASSGAAHADTQMLPGQQLVLNDNLSEDVVIGTDASLSGQIRLSMDGALSCLSIVSGHTLVVSTAGCAEEEGRLRIDVSPDTSVTINGMGDGNLRVGDLHAPLIATLSGSGDLTAGRSGALVLAIRGSGDAVSDQVDGPATIDITGSGNVRLRRVYGPLTSKQHGSGDLVVGAIQSDAVTMEATGSGDALVGAGRIATLLARFAGSADLAVAATIGDADVSASAGSDVKLGQVTGRLVKNASGGSDIIVGGSGLVNTIIGQSARKIGGDSSDGDIVVHESSSGFHHLLAGLVVILVCYIGWRIVRRGRGRRGTGQPAQGGPITPGVQALCETMTRLDQRLSRLESYVTTREFDLARKFRELEK